MLERFRADGQDVVDLSGTENGAEATREANHYEPTSVDHLTELHGTRQEALRAGLKLFEPPVPD